MKPPKLSLLCDSNPMCYGSSTALLAVLDHLDADVTALVHNVTAEVLSSDPAINLALSADVKDPDDVRRALKDRHADAVLVFSNQSNIALYLEIGLPVFFVDILYWFGHRKDQAVWDVAERTFVQAFPGVCQRAERARIPPTVVGPMIRQFQVTSKSRRGTLVQIGGGRSRWIHPGKNSDYAYRVADWLKHLTLPPPITLAGGRDALASIPELHPIRDSIEFQTLSHTDFLSRLGSSALYLTSPGLNAVFEGLQANIPLVFLPPQNATQVAQLDVYEKAGLVAPGLNLPELVSTFPSHFAELTEEQLTHAVIEALPQLGAPAISNRICSHLLQQCEELDRRAQARTEFLQTLGPPGGPTVARHIAEWWVEQWM